MVMETPHREELLTRAWPGVFDVLPMKHAGCRLLGRIAPLRETSWQFTPACAQGRDACPYSTDCGKVADASCRPGVP